MNRFRWPKGAVSRGPFGVRYYYCIYAIEAESVGKIKFGYTAGDIGKRFANIQTGSPVPVKLLGAMKMPFGTEEAVHEYLEADHSHGEWFNGTTKVKEVAELIAGNKAGALMGLINIRGLVL
jgi:hypothetical protein